MIVKTKKTDKMNNFHETISPSTPLFPRYAWCIVFITFLARRFLNKRRPRVHDLYSKVVDVHLEYYGATPLTPLSSGWNGDDLEKFDV